ncbi:MAG: archaeosortase/exosortase family protein [Candidatus Diapherotrites archaeon]
MVNLHSPTEWRKTLITFLVGWGVLFTIFFLFFSPHEYRLQIIEAEHVRELLNRVGIQTTDGNNPISFWMNGKNIEISPRCTGLIEFILLGTAILATKKHSLYARIKGIIIGIILLYGFNLARMMVTILQLEHTPLSFAMLTHDVLFRVLLIAGFALIYAGWVHRHQIITRLHAQELV